MASIINVDKLRRTGSTTDAFALNTSDTLTAFRPLAFSAYATGGQTISANTQTVIQYNNEHFDTDSCYDHTTNYRFTPNVAGIYYIAGSMRINGADDQEIYDLELRKNGTVARRNSANQYRYTSNFVEGLFEANGSSDYFDIAVYLGSSFALRTNAAENWFYGYFIRSLP